MLYSINHELNFISLFLKIVSYFGLQEQLCVFFFFCPTFSIDNIIPSLCSLFLLHRNKDTMICQRVKLSSALSRRKAVKYSKHQLIGQLKPSIAPLAVFNICINAILASDYSTPTLCFFFQNPCWLRKKMIPLNYTTSIIARTFPRVAKKHFSTLTFAI